MTDREIDEILADWRAAEAEADTHDGWSLDVEARIAALREEHAAALEARAGEARVLGSTPIAFPTEPLHREPRRSVRVDRAGPDDRDRQLPLPLD